MTNSVIILRTIHKTVRYIYIPQKKYMRIIDQNCFDTSFLSKILGSNIANKKITYDQKSFTPQIKHERGVATELWDTRECISKKYENFGKPKDSVMWESRTNKHQWAICETVMAIGWEAFHGT